MPDATSIKRQVDAVIAYLVEAGLADDQNFAIQRGVAGGRMEITFPQAEHVSIAMRDRSYMDIYQHLVEERAYSVRMPDGALLQIMYLFDGAAIERHRLAFFSAPYLEEFQNNPDIYLEETIYADVVSANIVPFPLRFDYDMRADVYKEVEHPKSHLSLGQYENCRIPVSAPLTPFWFIDFVLRNFYHTAFLTYADGLPKFNEVFEDSIAATETGLVHMRIPTGNA